MKQEAFAHYTDQHLTLLGFFIFFGFFVSLLFYVYRKSQTPHYQHMSQLPLGEILDGEENHE